MPGGGCAFVALKAGDCLSVTDPEGLQAAHLFAFDLAGRSAPAALGLSDAAEGVALEDLIAGGGEGTREAARLLAARGIDAAGASGRILLCADAAPGAAVALAAMTDLLAIVAAPGADMEPGCQDPPTDLAIGVSRAAGGRPDLPPPLAEVKLDLRIPAAQARAYRVKKGDYIQIIDVEGRQCADFLAFDAAALDRGEEFGLDATTTRTLMGAAFPGPGLHSKYYDARQIALVEVVQDTVGRHDTFALACTAKYYEDMGYPGHANCSDNFNAALKPYAIAGRNGWPAINFFYNTAISGSNALTMDEPWSRSGDYVLLQALTDLVCATSSCADDIDPANGWEPTDIHVRVYDSAEAFSKGTAFRMSPEAAPRLTRESAFHPRTSALTRDFVEYRGFWLPRCFSGEGPIAEYWACRERAAVMDLSALRKFEVIGPDAELLLQRTVTRDMRKLAVGQVVYTALCYAHGGMIDDATVFRLGSANFRLVCGEEFTGAWLRARAAEWGLKVWVKSSTDQLHNIAVQGPLSCDILEEVIWTAPVQPALGELKWFRFAVARLGGPLGAALVVSRTGYTGERGYEIWCHPKDAPAVWDAVWAAGAPKGLKPLGLDALDTLRVEAGLVFAGFDFCDQTDPFEAGIGFAVAEKDEDFIGRAALARRKANPARRMVGLVVHSNEVVGHGDPIMVGRAQVGVVTSAAKSPLLKQTIALARMDIALTESEVEIGKLDGHRKRLPAEVVPFPHFDPKKTRVRA
ncbi:aminomethyltransferase [Aquabacter spiritensis]|uniref:Aminomethyltransferase n=1 Tax=Aquabacter spiritensis TaxID=933073 RepID=A0A4R3M4N5_9HYPH|nr:aminomethyltransferase [Aquabacter spiritensis]